MEKNKQFGVSIPHKTFAVLPPTVLIVLNIFLFGPFNIYKGNISEFAVSLTSILVFYLLPALVLLFILNGIGMFLPKNLHRCYVVVIFVLGVLIWLQGNILVWKYGLVNGQAIDWNNDLWRGWVDSALWLLLLGFGFFFYKKIYRIVILGGIVLIFLQTAYLAFDSYQDPQIWNPKEFSQSNSLPQEICEFSSKQNVIHIILDGFQSNVFQKIIEDNLEYYHSALEGFTFFKETTGSFPTTRLSAPAFLSGLNYRNDIPMADFVTAVFQGRNIIRTLHEHQYDIDLIGAIEHIIKNTDMFSNAYGIPIPYDVSRREYEKANSALMLDLVLFRAAPHFLKKYIFNNQLWLVQQLLEQEEYARTFFRAHSLFLDDFINNVSVKRDKPVYKFIHLENTHAPFVVGQDCKYAGEVLAINIENAKRQDRCALDQVIRLFKKLKDAALYENSLIILQADHGIGLDVEMARPNRNTSGNLVPSIVVGGALPLLAIKQPQSKGRLRISKAQAMLTDIPATISSLLKLNEDFPGLSVFEIDPTMDRKRRYYHYKWRHEHWQADFFSRLDEYFIKGSVFDMASWQKGLTYFPPNGSNGSAYGIQKIDFGSAEATKFKRSGWGGDERSSGGNYTFNWALGSSASIFLSLPKNETVLLTANVKSLPFTKPQHITIKVDGKEIGSWELSASWNLAKHSIVIGRDKHGPNVSVVEFFFSQHQSPEGDLRPLAVLFESLTLSELTPYK